MFEGVTNQLSSIAGRQDLISQNLKDKYPKVFLDRSTSFNDLKSDFVIEDGKLLARNVSLRASEFDIGARGAIGFDKSIILSANLRLSRELTADLIKDFKEAKYLTNEQGQIEIPFALEGMLPKPKAKLEKDFVNRIIEKALVQKGFDLFEKQGLGDGLKDLFGGKKKAAPPDTTK